MQVLLTNNWKLKDKATGNTGIEINFDNLVIPPYVKKAKELREKRHEGKLPETFTVELVD